MTSDDSVSAAPSHIPVMLEEALAGLNVRNDGTYLDGTFGRGGHARALLARLGADARLLLMDRDPAAVAVARAEFGGDPSRDVVVETDEVDGGFVVRKPAPAAASLTVAPSLEAASMVCRYRFTLTNGMPPREDRIDVMFSGDDGETIQMKHHGTGQIFTTVEALSELLLVPVLTGRPR